MAVNRILATLVAGSALFASTPALATDDDFEVWFGPTFDTALDDNTSVEIQTAQRFRDGTRGRPDTYYVRGWIHQKVASNLTISNAVEERINDGGADEIRITQQIEAKHGILRTRFRLEERFDDDQNGRMGLRMRPRVGLRIPLSETSPITASVDGELFYTLRSTSDGGQTGWTGLETRVGFTYDVSDNVEIGLKYLRAQSLRDNREDKVSHAPLFEIGVTF